jgi:DNA-binding response OmpR family regulator
MVDVYGSRASWVEEVGSSSPSRILKKRTDERERAAKPHVLIVEDSDLVTGALRILFEETGRRVTVAHSVREAIAAARKDPPDLLLLDLTLPDGSGLEVAASLRQAGVEPRVMVAITGRDDPDSLQRCNDAGMTAVMVKPVSAKELLARTKEWLA